MKTLRPYQDEALDAVWHQVANGNSRALVVLASGLGKTVLAARLAYDVLNSETGRILFLVDNVDILRQARMEFEETMPSGVSVGILNGYEQEDTDAPVLFCTFQSMLSRLDSFSPDEFQVVIVDEAHHGQAVTYRRVIEHFDPALLFGMTATPDRMDGRDIRELFGEEVYDYPLIQALVDRQLADIDYRLLTDNISMKRLRRYIRRWAQDGRRVSRKQIDRTIFLKERLKEQVRIIRDEQTDDKQTIIFCRSIKHAKLVKKHFPEAEEYHSNLTPNLVRERFCAFKRGELRTILVVDKFNEGVDIPDAELVVFLRTTDSKRIWLQQLGRGLRRTETKDQVVVLDFVANCRRILMVHELDRGVRDYDPGGDDMPEPLVIKGFKVTFSEEIEEIFEVLMRLRTELYPTIEEAKEAVQRLGGIKYGPQYKLRYKEDLRLPSNPQTYYAGKGWKGWKDYLETAFYPTLAEAKAAVQRLGGASNLYIYLEKRTSDPKLPSSPHKIYEEEWRGWREFLETSFYRTLAEAKAAVQRLGGITSISQYRKRRKEDQRLPARPDKQYKDEWTSPSDFLGTPKREHRRACDCYQTLAEAKEAVGKLGKLRSYLEYAKAYKRDSKLPSRPHIVYAEKGWTGWSDFLGN